MAIRQREAGKLSSYRADEYVKGLRLLDRTGVREVANAQVGIAYGYWRSAALV